MAEKELAGFRSAVNEFFGSDRVQQAIENWMAKLQAMDWPLDGTVKGWRQLTIAAAARTAASPSIRSEAPAQPCQEKEGQKEESDECDRKVKVLDLRKETDGLGEVAVRRQAVGPQT
jgi:hypothetical protein